VARSGASNERGSKGQGGPRELARRVLQRVRRDDAYATLALAGELERGRGLSPADRALATQLVYGVLRRREQLDQLLAARLSRPLSQVNAEVLDVLRLAAFQLLALDRVPAYAAVDEAVGAARRLRGQRVAGFVNAVLRRIEREADGRDLDELLAALPAPSSPAAHLARAASLPQELAQVLLGQLGERDAAALGQALLEPARLTLRTNGLRISPAELQERLEEEGAAVRVARHAPGALHVADGGSERRWTPGGSAAYHEGLWTMQDEAAQLVSLLLAPRCGQRVLDACCGLGGKTTHLAELCGPSSGPPNLWAVDVSARKLELLEEHLLRLGLRCEARRGDLTEGLAGLPEASFDAVLLDAPCSGLGVLRRHPELKWRQGAIDGQRRGALVTLQRELLTAARRLLVPGGTLVYAVCTITAEEGPEQLRWLLETHPELSLTPPPIGSASTLSCLAPSGELALWPHSHGTDGFYAARLTLAKE
jgi:16S rRNA (cytosine967-C5)-methyltransferase